MPRKPPEWFPDWLGETVVVVASGPSAKDQPLETARGRCRFIVVNESWRLAPWADIHYACDYRYWRFSEGWKAFEGMRVCLDPHACNKVRHPDWNIHLIQCAKNSDAIILDRPGTIGWGSNSGFGAINIAAQLGVKAMILVGFDMSLHAGLHWHGPHAPKLGNPRQANLSRWRRAIDGAAKPLESAGIKVYNTASITGLKAYEKLDFKSALDICLEMTADSAALPAEPVHVS